MMDKLLSHRIAAGMFLAGLVSVFACGVAEDPQDVDPERVGTASQAISLGSSLGVPMVFPSGTPTSTCGLNNGVAPACTYSNASEIQFDWTAPSAGTFTFSTAGSNFDTVLVIAPYSTPTSPLVCQNAVSGTGAESASLTLSAGQHILITIDGYAALCGNFVLNVSKNCASPCVSSVCVNSACGVNGTCVNTALTGATCNDGNVCTTGDVCNSSGVCGGTPIVCAPPGQCYTSTCSGGSCQVAPGASGTSCSGGVCNGSGSCVKCLSGQTQSCTYLSDICPCNTAFVSETDTPPPPSHEANIGADQCWCPGGQRTCSAGTWGTCQQLLLVY
jgi:hypothetical protein